MLLLAVYDCMVLEAATHHIYFAGLLVSTALPYNLSYAYSF